MLLLLWPWLCFGHCNRFNLFLFRAFFSDCMPQTAVMRKSARTATESRVRQVHFSAVNLKCVSHSWLLAECRPQAHQRHASRTNTYIHGCHSTSTLTLQGPLSAHFVPFALAIVELSNWLHFVCGGNCESFDIFLSPFTTPRRCNNVGLQSRKILQHWVGAKKKKATVAEKFLRVGSGAVCSSGSSKAKSL